MSTFATPAALFVNYQRLKSLRCSQIEANVLPSLLLFITPSPPSFSSSHLPLASITFVFLVSTLRQRRIWGDLMCEIAKTLPDRRNLIPACSSELGFEKSLTDAPNILLVPAYTYGEFEGLGESEIA